ncbi:GUN4 domain-containing protein [cf. Phormidesmis sp. LEGE 11477]|uniref:GUN4 domain-containing protein n=1 Tax=cf. Phormidesmis sp. LEGE 11477 TaxID=1828680 RepID=UPI0018829207|nr:GUN4 domain-containing protein [cf. Phormidesmis sp. LEGE 11477]MBE9061657.1 GUN4 domain-containing protein [cf. Phormidesmis sp. LEGE 11477]
MAEQKFDVFLCHNSEDKSAVIEIAEQLRRQGLKPWLDVWELQPGAIWQFALEQQIESIGAVAVFAGQKGMGPWQSEEIYAFLQEFIRRKCPVIPVMLPETQTQPRLPIFLRNRHWVDFRLQRPNPLSQLIWGITGERPVEESLNTAETVSVQAAEEFLDVANSVLDARYVDLERYLRNGQWQEADNETYRLMITEVGKEEGQWFDPEDLLNFPCGPLRVIDELWVKHSEGRFGFSVQKDLYLKCGGIADGKYHEEAWEKFCETNGWTKSGRYQKVRYDTSAPSGHLPCLMPKKYMPLIRSRLSVHATLLLLSHPDL